MSRSFPPRAGAEFFLLWVAGLLVVAALSRITFENFLVQQLFWTLCQALGAGWSAYLIFPQWGRRAVWTVLPCLGWAAVSGVPEGLVLGLLAIIQFFLLVKVRRHPWLWLPISAFHIALITTVRLRLHSLQLDAAARIAEAISLSQHQVSESIEGAFFLAGEALGGFALAWWMAPKARFKE